MRLHEAIEKLKEKDELKRKDRPNRIERFGNQLSNKSDGKLTNFSVTDIYADDWQIIPSKPKPEIRNEMKKFFQDTFKGHDLITPEIIDSFADIFETCQKKETTELKALTAEECFDKLSFSRSGELLSLTTFKRIYGLIMKNGRLERDLEVRPVAKAIQKYQNDDSIEFHESGIFEALENLKPLNDE